MTVDKKAMAAFERDYREAHGRMDGHRFHVWSHTGEYRRHDLKIAFAIWQKQQAKIDALSKSRAEVIEECAKVCEESAKRLAGSSSTASGHVALVLVADEIRRLANKEGA